MFFNTNKEVILKILNLYAGIGGNRKLWSNNHQITAVEIDEKIAKIYKDNFPNDEVIVGDAHLYLLEHYKEYDFIWSSPPCPTHSRIRISARFKKKKDGTLFEQNKPVYPDMKLYEEIIFLNNYFDGFYCVENVVSYYTPLIKPQKLGRHYFWTNIEVIPKKFKSKCNFDSAKELNNFLGYNLENFKGLNKLKTFLS